MEAAAGGGYAVGWGTLALINAGLAQSKNRSGLSWFLLSLLLGPLATSVLVASYPAEQRPRSQRCVCCLTGACNRPLATLLAADAPIRMREDSKGRTC